MPVKAKKKKSFITQQLLATWNYSYILITNTETICLHP